MKTILLVFLGLTLALPAAAQQSPQAGKSAAEAKRQRERAIERCKANRGVDCETDAGLAEWMQASRPNAKAAEAKRQRERAIERCKANRGVDCETDAGLAEWLLQERSRNEAKAEGSRSIHQTAPTVAPRRGN